MPYTSAGTKEQDQLQYVIWTANSLKEKIGTPEKSFYNWKRQYKIQCSQPPKP